MSRDADRSTLFDLARPETIASPLCMYEPCSRKGQAKAHLVYSGDDIHQAIEAIRRLKP